LGLVWYGRGRLLREMWGLYTSWDGSDGRYFDEC
jgi:hypothetical protein